MARKRTQPILRTRARPGNDATLFTRVDARVLCHHFVCVTVYTALSCKNHDVATTSCFCIPRTHECVHTYQIMFDLSRTSIYRRLIGNAVAFASVFAVLTVFCLCVTSCRAGSRRIGDFTISRLKLAHALTDRSSALALAHTHAHRV